MSHNPGAVPSADKWIAAYSEVNNSFGLVDTDMLQNYSADPMSLPVKMKEAVSSSSSNINKIDEATSSSSSSSSINKIDETIFSSVTTISGDTDMIDEAASSSSSTISEVSSSSSTSDVKENADNDINPKVYSSDEAINMRNKAVNETVNKTLSFERTLKEFQFVENVYEFISKSNLAVVKGGAVRDMKLKNHVIQVHDENVQKFYSDQWVSPKSSGVKLLPVCQPVKIPRDIDCELCPIKNTDMTRELWDNLFVELFRLLRDEFGKNNVYEYFQAGGSRSHDYATFFPINVRTVVVQGNRIRSESITVDVISPLTLEECAAPSPSSSSSSSTAQQPLVTIKAEDALDLDVNGLYEKNYNTFEAIDDEYFRTEQFKLHPRLVHLGLNLVDVCEAIHNKVFTVVAVDALLRTKRLWTRVLDRFEDGVFDSSCSGWTGRFPTGPGEIMRHWKITWDGSRRGSRKRCVSTIDNEDGKNTIDIPFRTFDFFMAQKWGSTEEDLKNESEHAFRLRFMSGMTAEKRQQAQADLNDKLAKQVAKLERNSSFANECCVCMDNDSDHIIAGCGHLCICSGCADAVSSKHGFKCPICRVPGIRAIKVFIP